jgi:hypothetical protein
MRMAHGESTVVHNLAKKTVLHTFFIDPILRNKNKILIRYQPGLDRSLLSPLAEFSLISKK